MYRNRNKKIRYIIISLVALLAFTSTVAYALLSRTLNIGGNVSQKGGTWNIYLAEPSVYQATGSAKSDKAEIINNKTTLNIMPSLTQPNDSITYTFKVKNGGTVNAKFLGWQFLNASEFNALATKYKITTTLTYLDDTALQPYVDILEAKDEATLKLTFKYNGTSPITDDDVFLPIQIQLEYGQVNLATSSTPSTDPTEPSTDPDEYIDSKLNGNDPDLLNGSLTPVVYNGTNWVVADTTKGWHNYSNQEWANAVILNSGVTKNVGDIVTVPTSTSSTSEVKAMLVWIPRFEYKITGIFGLMADGSTNNTNNENPGQIEIKFISKTQTTADSGYTIHPAFTWDNNSDGTIASSEHISGIWVGKFETTGTADTPTILPNLQSLTSQNLSTQFSTSLKLKNYLSSVGTVDSHMAKSTEWAAVAYLSQSVYGKWGNTLYTGVNKEVYLNNSNKGYTGRSYGIPSNTTSGTTSGTCVYTDITDRGSGTGSCGGGASTTGNITGVYDMSGGRKEHVMNFAPNVKDLVGNYSGFGSDSNSISNLPATKYYDSYTDTIATSACNGGICYGHALSETINWYHDGGDSVFLNGNSPWVSRGGDYSDSVSAGIFNFDSTNGSANANAAFRTIILNPGN